MALFLGGCASGGNTAIKEETAQSVASKLIHGRTTKNQVRALYGDPYSTSFTDSGNEIWKYHFKKAHLKASSFVPVVRLFASGSKEKKKELVVLFNKRGIVQKHSMSTSDIENNTSLFQ